MYPYFVSPFLPSLNRQFYDVVLVEGLAKQAHVWVLGTALALVLWELTAWSWRRNWVVRGLFSEVRARV